MSTKLTLSASMAAVGGALLLLAYIGKQGKQGKQGKRTKTNKTHAVPEDSARPVGERMLLDTACGTLLERVDSARYDVRITEIYWKMRAMGEEDPEDIAAGILREDSPHCSWPPEEGSTMRARSLWESVYRAVSNYRELELTGKLEEFPAIFGTGEIIE